MHSHHITSLKGDSNTNFYHFNSSLFALKKRKKNYFLYAAMLITPRLFLFSFALAHKSGTTENKKLYGM